MFTLRCTQKLLARLKVAPQAETASPDTVLGDWYANLVRVGRQRVVLAISERTLLPVVLAVKDGRSLVQRLGEAVEPVLLAVGVGPDDIAAERHAMQAVAFGKTQNRRVLGSLNDLGFQLEGAMQQSPEWTMFKQSVWLARTPMKVIEYASPEMATVAAFAARRVISTLGQR